LAQKGLSMHKVREVLRLRFGSGLSARQVASSLGIARSTVAEYEQKARAAGVSWPLPAEMDDGVLHRALFGPQAAPTPRRGLPAIAHLREEMAQKHVTLMLLWSEYKESNPDGYQYTQFCEYYRRGVAKLDLVMRQHHRAGEKTFVDWAGTKLRVVDTDTGEVHPASLFVAVLGASRYTFAEAAPDESSPNWIRCHVHAYEFFGGVSEITVPDNTATAVRRVDRYEPELAALYHDMAAHYGTAIIPTRVRHPRDKAAVEAGVLVASRWIIAALRNRTFFSLAELNAEIARLRDKLNRRVMRHMRKSRLELYEQLDRPALRPLPGEAYQWLIWKSAGVGLDYHIELEKHYYSVPFQLVGERVDARLSPTLVEVLYKNQRVASHARSYLPGGFTTNPEHMPSSHRRYAEWTPARVTAWAEQTGPATAELATGIMQRRPHPEQGFRSCMGLISLARRYGPARVEAACRRALDLNAFALSSVKSILSSGLDQAPPRARAQQIQLALHENVRGQAYYQEVASDAQPDDR
jgi:transposase